MIIAVDFDGTIVEHRYPAIGKEILWSVREGRLLQEAVDYCKERGVNFYAVNADFEEEDGSGRSFSRKIKADLFIDDRNVGGLLDWGTIYALIQKNMGIEEYLIQEGVAQPRKKKSWWPF